MSYKLFFHYNLKSKLAFFCEFQNLNLTEAITSMGRNV